MSKTQKLTKRILCFVIAAIMLLSMAPFVFAANTCLGDFVNVETVFTSDTIEKVEWKFYPEDEPMTTWPVDSAAQESKPEYYVELTVTPKAGFEDDYSVIVTWAEDSVGWLGSNSGFREVTNHPTKEHTYTFTPQWDTSGGMAMGVLDTVQHTVYVATGAGTSLSGIESRFIVEGDLWAYELLGKGETPALPQSPVKEGYTFMGWKAASTGIVYAPGEAVDAITAAEQYHAVFDVNSYTVTYVRGAEADASEFKTMITVYDGANVETLEFYDYTLNVGALSYDGNAFGKNIQLASPMLPGYTFAGWQDQDGKIYPANAIYKVEKDSTLTALWSEKEEMDILVIFESDGIVYDAFLAYEGQDIVIPATDPAKAGFVFDGWANGAAIYSNDGVNTVKAVADADREMLFTAVWAAEEYSVKYSGDSVEASEDDGLNYGDSYIVKSAVAREGYTFVAWEDKATGAYYYSNTAITVTGDLDLVARWAEKSTQSVVKFIAEDGSVYDIYIVPTGSTITAPEYEAGRDYVTYEWRDEANRTYANAGDEITVSGDLVYRIVATGQSQFNVNVEVIPADVTNVVSFVAGNGKYNVGDNVGVSLTVPNGYVLKTVTGVTVTSRPLVDSLTTGDVYFFTMPAEDVNVTVVLEKVPVGTTLVKFVDDARVVDYQMVTKGTNGTAPAALTAVGKQFVNWVNGNIVVDAGGSYAVAADAPDEIVFSAVWSDEQYTVAYDAAGGTPQPAPAGNIYGDVITLAQSPTRDGFTFIGWQEASTGFVYGAGATYTVTGDVTFTAVWEVVPPNEYTVKFVDSTGAIYGYETVVEGDTVTAPDAPVVVGKTFVEWESNSITVNAGATTFPITSDTVFNAVFVTNSHNVTSSTANATVTPVSINDVLVGDTVEFTAHSNAGYELVSITLKYTDSLGYAQKELVVTDGGNYSFIMPDSDVVIVATAIRTEYVIAVTTNPLEAGIMVVYPTRAQAGVVTGFEVSCDDDYAISDVAVTDADGNPIAFAKVGNRYTFTMPYSDVNINIYAIKGRYTVTYLDDDNTVIGTEAVGSGDTVSNAPTPVKDGFDFAGWELLPQKTEFDPAKDTITADTIVRAIYVGHEFDVEAGLVDNVYYLNTETLVSSGSTNSANLLISDLIAEAGGTVYFKVAANYEYMITDVAVVSAAGTNLVIEPILREKETIDGIVHYTYAFTMPTEDVAIDIYTAPLSYTVTVNENIEAGGSYTVNGFYTNNLLVEQGKDVVIDIDTAAGYKVAKVSATYIDNFGNVADIVVTDGGDGSYTFKMVAKDVTVSIEYVADIYNIDVKTSNAQSYKPDTSKNPIEVIESLDDALTSKGLIIIDGIDDDKFEFMPGHYYDIPANCEAQVGTEVSFKVKTFTGYKLDTLSVTYADGTKTVIVTKKDDTYFFTMPADDVVITATYAEIEYTVTKADTAEAHGQVEMNGLIENVIFADYKDEVEITVVPDKGYYVESITYTLSDDTVLDFSAASYTGTKLTDTDDTSHAITFNMPASDVEVNVTYAPIDYTVKAVYNGDQTNVIYTTPANIGEQVTFETEAVHGYYIDKVYVTNDTTGELIATFTDTVSAKEIYGAEYKFTMPASSVTITVVSDNDVYGVIYTDAGGIIGGEDIEYLDEANVSEFVDNVVNAKPGHHFIGFESADVQTPVDASAPSVNDSDFIVVKDKTYISAVYAKDEIDVDFKATVNGTVTVNGNTAAYLLDTTVFGDTVEFTATPDEGYIVDKVSVTSTDADGYNLDIRFTENDGNYTFVIPATYKASVHDVQADDIVVEVTFKKDTFSLTESAASEDNGTVAINGKVTTQTSFAFDYQDDVTITATPDDGYYVVSIIAKGATKEYSVLGTKPANVTAGAPLTLEFKMPAEDLEYTVIYDEIDYDITLVYDSALGNVETTPADSATVDDLIKIDVTPNYGYVLKEIYVTGDISGEHIALSKVSDSEYNFTMPAEDVTVTVVFVKAFYAVTYKDWNGDVLKTEYIDYLDVAQIDVLTNELDNVRPGYHFIGWVSNDVQTPVTTPSLNKNDFVIVKATTITAVYEIDEVDVEFEATVNGTVTTDGKTAPTVTSAKVGDTIEFTATPDAGYVIDTVTVTTVDEGGDPFDVAYTVAGYDYSFVVPATFKSDATATKAESVIVEVTFKKAEYILSKAAGSETNGNIAVNGIVTTQTTFGYNFTDEVVITATPDKGYYVAAIKAVGGNYEFEVTAEKPVNVTAGDPLTLTFNMPDSDMEFTVDYEKIDYTITTVADAERGTVVTTPADVTTVAELVVVEVTPEYGYHIDTVQVRGNITGKYVSLEKDTEGKYHFEMPAEDVTVTATFAKNLYTVTFIDWNGDILSKENVEYLDAAVAPADPARVGYTFTGWDKDFSSVTENMTITAQYTIIVSEITSASISFTGVEHGKVTVPSGTMAEFGSVVTIVADPDDGWRFESISVLGTDGKYVPVSFVKEDADYVTTYSFVMPENAVNVTVSFTEQASSQFTDVRTDAWYYEAIEFVTDRGYFVGITDVLFAPERKMSRSMFVAVLARLNGADLSNYDGVTTYADVDAKSYYAKALDWATENKIVKGYNATEFGPNDNITREQMCSIIYRYSQFVGDDMTVENPEFMDRYTDTAKISGWAKDSVVWCVSKGLIKGYTNTTIAPQNFATRAQVAQVIRNYCDKSVYK